ncbi:MAG: hypothetical protein BJ554DRAFT_7554 [Olpidium bornovanus]|uniref:Cation-transporting P-type ATPase C-terminal domain-containing protein n=1 Tax=Olpidium bornovanus TaxID=278681 RepID=A0A8H8DJ64_9FUNG|nr:MAG: hypothetical protein BJ554DRAFT_7554 [Olpidium bornovanus]
MTIHKKPHETGEFSLYQKGAPERILRLCKTIYVDGAAVPLTAEHRSNYNQAYEYLASTGQRVLAFAQALLPSSEYPSSHEFDREKGNYPTDTLTFLGLVSLEDPPKHGVREAIGRCRSAGIQIIMVTGDHPLTAEAIGRKINMMISETKPQMAKRRGIPVEQIDENEVDAVVVHGEQIDDFDDHDWDIVFSKTEVIFARTSPKHKLTIVKRAQAMGHIVGVTGDGPRSVFRNWCPAAAYATVVINRSSLRRLVIYQDVSKEAAAMILLDDNFASVVNGIEQGRLMCSITYTITHTLPELMAVLLFVVVPLPMPISAMLILLIDLGFELALGLSFAWDVPESRTGLMKMLPRKPVTYDSIARLRRRREREAKRRTELGYKIDEESGEEASPGVLTVIKEKLATPFRGSYWKEKLEKTDDEVLVDGNVLSYAYFEMGIIETLSAITAFFAVFWVEYGLNPTCVREAQILADGQFGTADTIVVCAQGAYYLSVMVNQVCNSFVKKARLRLPFGKFMVSNPVSFVATAIAALFAFFIVYTPGVREGLLVEPLQPFWIILIPLGYCVVQILYVTLRVLVLRKVAPEKYNPDIEGLQMYPTVRSARSGRSGRH